MTIEFQFTMDGNKVIWILCKWNMAAANVGIEGELSPKSKTIFSHTESDQWRIIVLRTHVRDAAQAWYVFSCKLSSKPQIENQPRIEN